MRRLFSTVTTVSMLLAGGAASAADEPKATSLVGEVVDLHCYLTRSARGAEHKGCADACIGRGVAPGLLTSDGKLYLLLSEKPFSAKDAVAGRAGDTVTVRGRVLERGGVQAVQLQSIEPAKL
jgi:hypothetical protein